MITVNQIFNYIQGVNPAESTMSSIGSYVSDTAQQVSDGLLAEVINNLPVGTLAHTIATGTTGRFTDKQLWVIAYELLGNTAYSTMIEQHYAALARKANAKYEASKAKLSANKEASADVLASVKSAGKKLGDYYTFIKSNKQFAREFFSKKFTQESVNAFINQ